jgi:DNA modification methylase
VKPYYQDEYATIYHGDCREVLPFLPQADLLLTDPPYGIGKDGHKPAASKRKKGNGRNYAFKGWDSAAPSDWLLMLCLEKARDAVVWGANYYPHIFPPSMGWLVWDKGQDLSTSDCELAYTSRDGALRRLLLNRRFLQLEEPQHPTQKPLALIKWCIGFFPEAQTILDPFMGSGTTLRAAKDAALTAVGIDIDEEYCEIAAERLRQRVLWECDAQGILDAEQVR